MPARAHWKLGAKHYFNQQAKVTACAYHTASEILVAAFDSGVFALFEMPACTNVHTLSISQHAIDSVAINPSGEWLAFGSSRLGQLLVWEWQSETYALKQQGHFAEPTCLAYSADGQTIATGGADAKVKLWNVHSGFSFVTFTRTPPHRRDLHGCGRRADERLARRHRPGLRPGALPQLPHAHHARARPVHLARRGHRGRGRARQYEPYEAYVWSLQTGRLLDLSGHEGPVASLCFNPMGTTLVSGSWTASSRGTCSRTRRRGRRSAVGVLVAYRPDGQQLATSTLHGHILLWDEEGEVSRSIDGRRDIVGGRLQRDRTSAENSAGGKCFTSLCYSADGACIIAAGRSKYVCIYELSQGLLLKKFQVSHNRALDGVLNQLHSGRMTEAGPAGRAGPR